MTLSPIHSGSHTSSQHGRFRMVDGAFANPFLTREITRDGRVFQDDKINAARKDSPTDSAARFLPAQRPDRRRLTRASLRTTRTRTHSLPTAVASAHDARRPPRRPRLRRRTRPRRPSSLEADRRAHPRFVGDISEAVARLACRHYARRRARGGHAAERIPHPRRVGLREVPRARALTR